MRRSVGSWKEKPFMNCAYVPEPISNAAEEEASTNPTTEHFMLGLKCSGRRRAHLYHPQPTQNASPPKTRKTTILSATGPMLHTVEPSRLTCSITGVTATV